ncbi:MAG: hypothetical protein ACOYYJ_20325, partial [Chloroflexota bacterium]
IFERGSLLSIALNPCFAFCHCEEGAFPDEAISLCEKEIASPLSQLAMTNSQRLSGSKDLNDLKQALRF